jgi:diguanylate cyclase (GGDEF)-like protein
LRKNVRTQDTIGRYGGEEFIILLPDTTINECEQVAERIRVSIAEHELTTKNDRNIKVSASVGMTQWRKDDDIHSIIVRADRSLYKAKNQGRNRVVSG